MSIGLIRDDINISLFINTTKIKGEKKVLNTICQCCWVSLLELGLVVTTYQFLDSKDVSFLVRVTVRVMIGYRRVCRTRYYI